MDSQPLLGPVIALVAWSLVMLVWLAVKRAPFMKNRAKMPPGVRGADMPPGPHNWPAHNYAHLMEQPTLFYAIVLALALMGENEPINVALAWGYAILRIAHSIWQSTVNVLPIRFALFALSSLCLLGLTVHAAMHWLHS
ncbi:MAPEG family protein [Sphingomonas mesophila]|uniref:MAPEG family protein n=1 Tax=Sphingomonas mesophila TaxID=2303576 RepID=UPI000E57522A|nr:MAPEG family protein [Sphingomonas mesophila]